MMRSDDINELAAALVQCQGEFESVGKTAANPFFKSSYAPLPEVVKAATPILVKHGLAISQHPGHDEDGDTLDTLLLHTSGQFLGNSMHLRPVKDDPQAQGSALTYARRYAYMAVLGLVAEEDDDGNAASQGTRTSPSKRPARKAPAPKANAIGAEGAKTLRAEIGKALKDMPVTQRMADVQMRLVAAGAQDPTDIDKALAALTPEQADALRKGLPGA